ncbi:MAG: phosphoglucosamine mutase [Candidatus Latescibacterota bacterium]|nr:MAG: phosphoglucosamine mutase [Candidatus Latescibacterota bacterium]
MIQRPSGNLLFSVAGARGIVGEGLNVDVVLRLTLAFCANLPGGDIVVGRDTRPSGESLESAVIGAVTASGRGCITLGVATTPTVEMMVEKLGAAGGVIVTASHNPVEWNALKFLDDRGTFISKTLGDAVHDTFVGEAFHFAPATSTGDITRYHQASRDHIDATLALPAVDSDGIRRRGFKVVVDAINGAGSVIAPDMLRELGVDVVAMNCKTDGDFYRDPEPRPAHLGELAERVRNENADVGFALDPDADRLALIDNNGVAISEEYTLALAVDQILAGGTNGPVVVNLSTSALIDWIANRHQTAVVRTPVGEAHVVSAMIRENSPIGGEGNGGVIYPELHPGRDGLLGMALILQLLASRDVTLSDQVGEYPSFHMTKTKLDLGGAFSPERISGLIEGLGPAKIDRQDGIKAIFDDGWFHVRVSNTEGVVRVIAESLSETRTAALQSMAEEVLNNSWGM